MIKNLAIAGGSNKALLFLALILGLVCAVLVGVYLSGLDKDGGSSSSGSTVPVVVASADIAPLTVITEQMLTVKEIPADLALTGTFTSFDQAVGQTAKVQIVAGEPVMATKVTSAASAITAYGESAPLSLIIPQGKRAFAIYLSPVAAAGGLSRPGDHVDVLLSTEGSESAPAGACYVLQDVEVLAIGESLKRTASEGDTSGIASASTNVEATAMTLAVTPQEAWQLAAYQKSVNQGNVGQQLWVSLRPFSERGAAGDIPACTPGS